MTLDSQDGIYDYVIDSLYRLDKNTALQVFSISDKLIPIKQLKNISKNYHRRKS